jgi:hypothetical protein
MTAHQHLRLIEKTLAPSDAFNKLVTGISQPQRAIEPYYCTDNAIIYNNDSLEILARIPEDTHETT